MGPSRSEVQAKERRNSQETAHGPLDSSYRNKTKPDLRDFFLFVTTKQVSANHRQPMIRPCPQKAEAWLWSIRRLCLPISSARSECCPIHDLFFAQMNSTKFV